MALAVDFENVDFVRGGKTILDRVNWTVAPREHTALIGENGSGKTTMLKIVAGYEWPTRGRVSILGAQFGKTDLRELRKRIGWVSSAITGQIPGKLRALDVVASGIDSNLALYRDIGEGEYAVCLRAMERFGISGLAEQELKTLSQGERQRLRIARALVCDPDLLILDEPCAGLDPVSRRGFLDELAEFASDEAAPTILFVTHHIEEIGSWLGAVHAIREGRTVANGDRETVLCSETLTEVFGQSCVVTRQHDEYVASFESR